MRQLGKLLRTIILLANVLFVLLLWLSAFSPYLDPKQFPILSCAGLAFPIFLTANICFMVFWLLFYKRYVIAPLLGLIICAGQIRTYIPININLTNELPEGSFKVLSYNCMAFDGHKMHTKESPNPILQYIVDSNADIVCMQEFIMGEGKDLLKRPDVEKALSAYKYVDIQALGTTNGLACFSKFPILSSQQIEYKSEYNGTIMYELLVNGDTLVLINNHLESNKLTLEDKNTYVDMIKSPEKEKVTDGMPRLINKLLEASQIRRDQAQHIYNVMDTLPANRLVVMCGDFNDSPISYPHRLFTQKLEDAFVQSGNGFGISYNQKGFYFRIDNILISEDLEAFNCTVDRSIKDSDHYPIWTYISKKE